MKRSVLGIDMACSWANLGSAILEFSEGRWSASATGVVTPSSAICDPRAVANQIDRIASSTGCSAVGIDGPQGWRDPLANRSFVGRLCEWETHTPGKTGTYNKVYPGTLLSWITFSISVFDHLLANGRAILANNPARELERLPEGRYYLLECFPTSTWRSTALAPLKGHAMRASEVEAFAERLREAYGLPKSVVIDHHDNLQAIVCCLPAAGLVGGPCKAIPRGEPARIQAGKGFPNHRVEGLIWDGIPLREPMGLTHRPRVPEILATEPRTLIELKEPIVPSRPPEDDENMEVLTRGIRLFSRLVDLANSGEAVGVGYGQFVARVNGARTFKEFRGRPFAPSDIGPAIQLAVATTKAAGGRKSVSRGGATILAGMDTFIWSTDPPFDRSVKAWESKWSRPPYSREDWSAIFPGAKRKLMR